MCAIGSTKQSRSSPPSVNWLDFLLQFVIFPLFLNRSKRLIVLFAYTCAWISFYPSPSMSYYLEEGWSRMPLLSHTLSESGSFLQMKWKDKPSREKKKQRERQMRPLSELCCHYLHLWYLQPCTFQAPHQPGQPGFKFTVAESCDRIKDEFQFLQAQYHR